MKHTPTPWSFGSQFIAKHVGPSVLDYEHIATIPDHLQSDDPQWEANAAFIVQACNSHDDLVAACELALTIIGHPDDAGTKFIADALKRAKGEA